MRSTPENPVSGPASPAGVRVDPPSAIGPSDALEAALRLAVERGDLALVARIVGELEARRRDGAGVVELAAARKRKA